MARIGGISGAGGVKPYGSGAARGGGENMASSIAAAWRRVTYHRALRQ